MHSSCFKVAMAVTIAASLVLTAGAEAIAQNTAEVKVPGAPEEGGPRRWLVVGSEGVLLSQPSEVAGVVRPLEKGEVLSNEGCQEKGQTIWCNIRPFRGGRGGYVELRHLQPARGPDGVVPTGVDDSRHRAAKRDFDTTSKIACAQERGQDLGTCQAAAARGDGGDATIVVSFPNGFQRKLYFVHGEFVRASATMSGVGTDFDWRLEGDFHFVRVDDQRFELPQSLIFED